MRQAWPKVGLARISRTGTHADSSRATPARPHVSAPCPQRPRPGNGRYPGPKSPASARTRRARMATDATKETGLSPGSVHKNASGGREGITPARTLRQRGNTRIAFADRRPLFPPGLDGSRIYGSLSAFVGIVKRLPLQAVPLRGRTPGRPGLSHPIPSFSRRPG